MPLYFTADLRSARLNLPLPPAALWLQLAGEPHPLVAWLLTPATYARCWWGVVQLEDRWARGNYPEQKLDLAAERLAVLTWYTDEHFHPAEVEQAKLAIQRAGGSLSPLQPPAEPPPADPWIQTPSVVYDGTTGRFRSASKTDSQRP